MALQAGDTGPYAPPGAISETIDRYRDRGIQTPITRDVLERIGIPDSLSARTLQALRLLDFIGADGQPTPELERLSRVRDDGEYKQGLRDMLTAAYAEVYSFVDPATDPLEKVRGAFRAYNPRGQQERMVTLFLGLCEWAGMDVSAAMASKKKAPSPINKPVASKAPAPSRVPVARTRANDQTAGARIKRSGSVLAEVPGLPPGLVGLLHQIPQEGAGWTKDTRDHFVAAFTAVLDFTVPIRPVGLEDFTDADAVDAEQEEDA